MLNLKLWFTRKRQLIRLVELYQEANKTLTHKVIIDRELILLDENKTYYIQAESEQDCKKLGIFIMNLKALGFQLPKIIITTAKIEEYKNENKRKNTKHSVAKRTR